MSCQGAENTRPTLAVIGSLVMLWEGVGRKLCDEAICYDVDV